MNDRTDHNQEGEEPENGHENCTGWHKLKYESGHEHEEHAHQRDEHKGHSHYENVPEHDQHNHNSGMHHHHGKLFSKETLIIGALVSVFFGAAYYNSMRAEKIIYTDYLKKQAREYIIVKKNNGNTIIYHNNDDNNTVDSIIMINKSDQGHERDKIYERASDYPMQKNRFDDADKILLEERLKHTNHKKNSG